MLDSGVARQYGYQTKNIIKAMKRNIERFPETFCFQLTEDEYNELLRFQIGTLEEKNCMRSQIATASKTKKDGDMRFQSGTASEMEKRNKRHLPYVFNEQGIAS